jgi:hypothetical protein
MFIKSKMWIVRVLSIVILFSGVVSTAAQAQMISASQVQQQQDKAALLSALSETLAKEDIQKTLLSLGVDIQVIEERANNLTSEELAQLNSQIDELPAGSGAIGVLVFIFVVFVITDAIGATDVFPFVNKVN